MIALVSNMEGSGTQESVTPGGALAGGAPEVYLGKATDYTPVDSLIPKLLDTIEYGASLNAATRGIIKTPVGFSISSGTLICLDDAGVEEPNPHNEFPPVRQDVPVHLVSSTDCYDLYVTNPIFVTAESVPQEESFPRPGEIVHRITATLRFIEEGEVFGLEGEEKPQIRVCSVPLFIDDFLELEPFSEIVNGRVNVSTSDFLSCVLFLARPGGGSLTFRQQVDSPPNGNTCLVKAIVDGQPVPEFTNEPISRVGLGAVALIPEPPAADRHFEEGNLFLSYRVPDSNEVAESPPIPWRTVGPVKKVGVTVFVRATTSQGQLEPIFPESAILRLLNNANLNYRQAGIQLQFTTADIRPFQDDPEEGQELGQFQVYDPNDQDKTTDFVRKVQQLTTRPNRVALLIMNRMEGDQAGDTPTRGFLLVDIDVKICFYSAAELATTDPILRNIRSTSFAHELAHPIGEISDAVGGVSNPEPKMNLMWNDPTDYAEGRRLIRSFFVDQISGQEAQVGGGNPVTDPENNPYPDRHQGMRTGLPPEYYR